MFSFKYFFALFFLFNSSPLLSNDFTSTLDNLTHPDFVVRAKAKRTLEQNYFTWEIPIFLKLRTELHPDARNYLESLRERYSPSEYTCAYAAYRLAHGILPIHQRAFELAQKVIGKMSPMRSQITRVFSAQNADAYPNDLAAKNIARLNDVQEIILQSAYNAGFVGKKTDSNELTLVYLGKNFSEFIRHEKLRVSVLDQNLIFKFEQPLSWELLKAHSSNRFLLSCNTGKRIASWELSRLPEMKFEVLVALSPTKEPHYNYQNLKIHGSTGYLVKASGLELVARTHPMYTLMDALLKITGADENDLLEQTQFGYLIRLHGEVSTSQSVKLGSIWNREPEI